MQEQRRGSEMSNTATMLGDRLLRHGLVALVIGGALLIASVWLVTLHLASSLGQMHVQAKMADIARKAQLALQQDDEAAGHLQALQWLARFRDVRRMELHDAAGKVIWRNPDNVSRVVRAAPENGQTVLEQRTVDGLPRIMARHAALLRMDDKPVQLVLEADVSTLLASYRQVAMLVAKAITTALLAGIFLMGWLITLRWREQRALIARLREMLAQEAGQPVETGDDWRQMLDALSTRNAALLRRMTALAQQNAGEDTAEQAEAAGQPAAQRHRQRA